MAKRLLGESKEDAMASIILITLEIAFKLYKGHLTSHRWWKSDEAMVVYIMRQESMRHHWKQNKHLYNHEFVRFIDKIIQNLDQEKQLARPASAQTGEAEKK